ncbi:hypothetical protein RCL1_002155 [Eukaryota sp. TZLM3-RCL]
MNSADFQSLSETFRIGPPLSSTRSDRPRLFKGELLHCGYWKEVVARECLPLNETELRRLEKAFNHQNIVSLLSVVKSNSSHFLVFEHCGTVN